MSATNAPVADPNHQSVLHFEGEGPVHRSIISNKGKLVRDHEGITTVHELAAYVRFLSLTPLSGPLDASMSHFRRFLAFFGRNRTAWIACEEEKGTEVSLGMNWPRSALLTHFTEMPSRNTRRTTS